MEQSTPEMICLTDGHAGNRRQALALAHALGFPSAPHVDLAPGALARLWAPRRFPGAARALGPAFRAVLEPPPALAIGCGRQSALATRLLREAGSRVIQILDPRIDPRYWDRVIVPRHDRLQGANVIALSGSLNEIDDLWLARARSDFPAIGTLPGPRVALLVGGPGKHWTMDDAAFLAVLRELAESVAARGGSLLASGSRRTPPAWREALRGSGAAIRWCDEGDGPNPYRGVLAWADAIVCTADSVNMLSEASATQVPVHVLGEARLQGRPRMFLDELITRSRVRPFTAALAPFPVTPLHETARVAGELQPWLATALATPVR